MKKTLVMLLVAMMGFSFISSAQQPVKKECNKEKKECCKKEKKCDKKTAKCDMNKKDCCKDGQKAHKCAKKEAKQLNGMRGQKLEKVSKDNAQVQKATPIQKTDLKKVENK